MCLSDTDLIPWRNELNSWPDGRWWVRIFPALFRARKPPLDASCLSPPLMSSPAVLAGRTRPQLSEQQFLPHFHWRVGPPKQELRRSLCPLINNPWLLTKNDGREIWKMRSLKLGKISWCLRMENSPTWLIRLSKGRVTRKTSFLGECFWLSKDGFCNVVCRTQLLVIHKHNFVAQMKV